jgi:hypothetical protein
MAASDNLRLDFVEVPDSIAAHAMRMMDLLDERYPPSQERSLAMASIEQAMSWARLVVLKELERLMDTRSRARAGRVSRETLPGQLSLIAAALDGLAEECNTSFEVYSDVVIARLESPRELLRELLGAVEVER